MNSNVAYACVVCNYFYSVCVMCLKYRAYDTNI